MKASIRQTMKKSGLNYFCAAVILLLPSCSSFNRSHVKPNLTGKSDIYQVLYHASLAGSSHNSQPWRVEVYGNDSILVFADTTRKLPVVDPSGREMYMSVGAFIENLGIAAACYGYTTDIRINKRLNGAVSPVASIRLSGSGKTPDKTALDEITKRMTLRIAFDTVPLNAEDKAVLMAGDQENIHFIDASAEKGIYLRKQALAAYEQQAFNRQAQDELAGWMRFSNKDVRENLDGLTTAGMGITGMGGFMVRNFYKPEDSKKESFVTQGVDKTKRLVENCGGWILISQPADNVEGWINTGRLYQCIHLRCRKLNIGFHPMNQILEETKFREDPRLFAGYPDPVLFIARVGYVSEYPEPVSVRRPVEGFTVFR